MIDWAELINDIPKDAKAIDYMKHDEAIVRITEKYREEKPLLLIDVLLRAYGMIRITRRYLSDNLFYDATIAEPTILKGLSTGDVMRERPELLNEKVERITIQKEITCPLFEIELAGVMTTDAEVTRIAEEHGGTPHKCPRLERTESGLYKIVCDE